MRGLDAYCCCESCKYLMRKIKHMLYLEDTLNINMLNVFMFSHVKTRENQRGALKVGQTEVMVKVSSPVVLEVLCGKASSSLLCI